MDKKTAPAIAQISGNGGKDDFSPTASGAGKSYPRFYPQVL
ncbi:MAG: hypothetical protein OXE47_08030 [Gammaproteobacteria bacterium]|nr:hypothetical protein [Gammaproteobacteria bacterium]